MTDFNLEDVGLRGRLLTARLPATPRSTKVHIPVPFGSIVRPSEYNFLVAVGEDQGEQVLRSQQSEILQPIDQIEQLLAVPKNGGDRSAEIQILPPYERAAVMRRSGAGEVELRVWQVMSDADYMQAMKIILRSHYLNAPAKGLVLGCRFVRRSDQENVRHKARRVDNWSEAWREESGQMIACAVLDTMYHGNPRGRREIAETLLDSLATDSTRRNDVADLLEGDWQSKKRETVVNTLRVAYASRFAVDAPYRWIGVGTLLAQCLADVAAQRRVPPAEFLEVITTRPTQEVEDLLTGRVPHRDFLEGADYTLVREGRPSRRILLADQTTGDKVHPASAKKLYYFKKLEGSEQS